MKKKEAALVQEKEKEVEKRAKALEQKFRAELAQVQEASYDSINKLEDQCDQLRDTIKRKEKELKRLEYEI